MYPTPLFEVFGQAVNAYLLSYFLGALFVLSAWLALTRDRNVPASVVVDAWFVAMACAFVGGSLLSAVVAVWTRPILRGDPVWAVLLGGGLASLGAIPAAPAGTWLLMKRRRDVRDRRAVVFDAGIVCLPLYEIVARFGCVTAGCCHGRPAPGLPWAITFTQPGTACVYRGIPVHPTQLYQVAGCAVVLALLLWLRRRPGWQGTLVWVYFAAYGLLRFVVEFFRGDVRPMLGPLSVFQIICLGFVGMGTVGLLRKRQAWRKHPAPAC